MDVPANMAHNRGENEDRFGQVFRLGKTDEVSFGGLSEH